jgi:uncharacterized protein DUF6519/parallel beta helix pectate lyase-like protein
MSGDYSRVRFDPKNDFSGVLMQQGRVQLDSDWNELIALLDRRLRAETTDIIGRATVPKETPDGFRIQIAGGVITIGRGRIYVDGLLAENHGKAPLDFDPVLAEQRGTQAVPYNEQPYFPNVSVVAPAPSSGGPHLVYLDVWQREVTHLQDGELIEKAVGVDTTARVQTVWQVKLLSDVGNGATCGSPIEAWNALTAPSAGRLSSKAVGVPTNTDPCLIPPSGGYRGLDNRLYRVEIHDGGPSGTATFKWSRDNASVATSVTAITALDKLTVASVGRDSVMHFKIGDWIEITDDWLEFARQPGVNPVPPGVMAQVQSVDDANRMITLVSPLPANVFGTDAQGNTDPLRHTRVRRWDQSGQVRDTNGNLLVDLNAPGSKGAIPVPAAGTSIVLEDGVQITFDTPAGGIYKIADYWNFAARTTDASVEELKQSPPLGVHHHFCRLALVMFPNSITDCRTLWPPEVAGEGCECTVCVSAESHNQGSLTIQMAVEQVKAAGGGTICLGVGTYRLGEAPLPINISDARSLTLRGQGAQTSLVYAGRGPAILVDRCMGVTLEKFTLATAASEGDFQPAILFTNSSSVVLQRTAGLRLGNASSAVVGLAGVLIGLTVRENTFAGPIGIGNVTVSVATGAVLAAQSAPLLTMSLSIEDNMLLCSRRGISFAGVSVHALETRFAGNFINDCAQGGIVATGVVLAGASLHVHGNDLRAAGQGIVVGTSGAHISANSISSGNQRTGGDAIVLTTGMDKTGIDQCHVIANRITGAMGIGIAVETVVKAAMIKNNFIDGAIFGGIVMSEKSSGQFITVENNRIANIRPRASDGQADVFGVRLFDVARGEVVNNAVSAVGLQASSHRCVGVQLAACGEARVAGNEIVNIGPPEGNAQTSAGIESIGTFEELDVSGNSVRRNAAASQITDSAEWYAVLISGAQAAPPRLKGLTSFFAARANIAFLFSPGRLVAKQPGRESVSLRHNLFDAYGVAEAVMIAVAGACAISDNRCLLRGRAQPAIQGMVASAIVSSNHVQGTQGRITVTLRLPERGPFTVLGNITTHAIEINGAVLAAPWAPLNVQGV